MDLIEKAAQRLAQLQKAGIDAPVQTAPAADPPRTSRGAEAIPTPERLARALEQAQPADARAAVPAPIATPGQAVHVRRSPAETGLRSKEVHIDLEALAATVDRTTRAVFLPNPAMPTGVMVSGAVIATGFIAGPGV